MENFKAILLPLGSCAGNLTRYQKFSSYLLQISICDKKIAEDYKNELEESNKNSKSEFKNDHKINTKIQFLFDAGSKRILDFDLLNPISLASIFISVFLF